MDNIETHRCSTIDSIWPPVIQRWILPFRHDSNQFAQTSDFLSISFERTLQRRPCLGGTLKKEHNGVGIGRLEVHSSSRNKEDIRFWVNDLRAKEDVWPHTYDELYQRGMPISSFTAEVLGPLVKEEILATLPIAAQANFIYGGCLLYICLNHAIFDGKGAAAIIGEWADNFRELSEGRDGKKNEESRIETYTKYCGLPGVFQNSSAPKNHEAAALKQNDRLWQMLGLKHPDYQESKSSSPVKGRRESAIFSAPLESIERLRSSISLVDSTPMSTNAATTFETIASLLWRSIVRAKAPHVENFKEATARLRIPVDVRKPLGIPQTYLGNAFLNTVIEMPLAYLAAQATHDSIVSKLHLAIGFTKDTFNAGNAAKLSFLLPEPHLRTPLFDTTMAENLVLTDWKTLPFLEKYWGSSLGTEGRADCLRIPKGCLPGICAILPTKSSTDVEVLVSLPDTQLSRLTSDVDFSRYFTLKCM